MERCSILVDRAPQPRPTVNKNNRLCLLFTHQAALHRSSVELAGLCSMSPQDCFTCTSRAHTNIRLSHNYSGLALDHKNNRELLQANADLAVPFSQAAPQAPYIHAPIQTSLPKPPSMQSIQSHFYTRPLFQDWGRLLAIPSKL